MLHYIGMHQFWKGFKFEDTDIDEIWKKPMTAKMNILMQA